VKRTTEPITSVIPAVTGKGKRHLGFQEAQTEKKVSRKNKDTSCTSPTFTLLPAHFFICSRGRIDIYHRRTWRGN